MLMTTDYVSKEIPNDAYHHVKWFVCLLFAGDLGITAQKLVGDEKGNLMTTKVIVQGGRKESGSGGRKSIAHRSIPSRTNLSS